METMNIEVPFINTNEIKEVLNGMSKGKARGADGLSIDLMKDASDFVLDKLAIRFPHPQDKQDMLAETTQCVNRKTESWTET